MKGGKYAESFQASGLVELACLVLLLQVSSIEINSNNNNRINFFIFTCYPCSGIDAIIHSRKYDEVPTSKHEVPFNHSEVILTTFGKLSSNANIPSSAVCV